jgi:hypothetical protein
MRWVICFLLLGSLAWAQTTECTDGCSKAISSISQLPRNPADPLFLFNLNQTCIARQVCAKREQLENPDWFERVIERFISEYIKQTGNWPEVIANCYPMVLFPLAVCTDTMVKYHIGVDLYGAMLEEGCGTERDWNLIGEIILSDCVRPAPVEAWLNAVAEWVLPIYRSEVRERCLRARTARGLPLYGNP